MRPYCFILLFICFQSALAQEFDVLIKNGAVYDGLGNTPKKIAIGIKGERIIALGDLDNATAKETIDADGLAIAPGIIDLHAHIQDLMNLPEAESALQQGVTLTIGGPDGGGPTNFVQYVDSLTHLQLGSNVGYQIGHNVVREKVLGLADRPPNAEELVQMQNIIEEAMQRGAFGLSTGLTYVPGAFSEINEIIALAKVAAANGGFYTSHIRDESLHLIAAVNEAIQIGNEADITAIITHHKALGAAMWGTSETTLKMIDSANAAGLDIRLDQYPYTASSTTLNALIPPWAREGGQQAFEERIANPSLRDSVKKGIVFNIVNVRVGTELNRLQFRKFPYKKELEGKTMEDWTLMEKLDPTPENAADLVILAALNGSADMIYHVMDEEDVDRIMRHPKTMIASDGKLNKLGVDHPHPRAYGTFPRVLGYYVRDRGVLPLSEAIKKMTSMPADALGLQNRGRIAVNAYADLVLFDPDTIRDEATFEDPHHYPTGIHYVLVNGKIALINGTLTGAKAGRLILRNAN